jgi:phytanoyl-CoA hydroxylase
MYPSAAILVNGKISPANKMFYKNSGFLIAPSLLSAYEIKELKLEMVHIFRGERGKIEGLLDVDKSIPDNEVLKKYVAIHFPHKLSSLIYQSLFHPLIVDALKQIVGENLKCMQSMLFVKGPGKAGQSWHQDEYYIPTRDQSLVGSWIAIDDATIENGCLWIIPGRPGFIMRRVKNDNPEYADVDTIDVSSYIQQALSVEVKSGTVIFFNGYTLHSSQRNKTANCFRMALVSHYMSAESMLPWDQDGKLRLTEDLRDIVMIAGEDRYGFKGTVELNKPFLRPEVFKAKSST